MIRKILGYLLIFKKLKSKMWKMKDYNYCYGMCTHGCVCYLLYVYIYMYEKLIIYKIIHVI